MDSINSRDLQKILSDPAAMQRLAASGEAKALAKLLTQQRSAASLQRAARSAAGGDTGQLAELLRSVTASPEGAKLLSSLQKALEQQT